MRTTSNFDIKRETRKLKKLADTTFIFTTASTSIGLISDEIVEEIVTVFKDYHLLSQHLFHRCKVLAPDYDRQLKSRLGADRVKLFAYHAVLHFFAMSGFFLIMPTKLDWHPWIYRLPGTSIVEVARKKTVEVNLSQLCSKLYDKIYDCLARAGIVHNNAFTKITVHQTVAETTKSYSLCESFSHERLMGWIHFMLVELPLTEHRLNSPGIPMQLKGQSVEGAQVSRTKVPFELASPESLF